MKNVCVLLIAAVLAFNVCFAEYYIDIKANYINESKVTVTDVDIHRLSFDTWRLNSTNANYAIQRAKVIQQLYGDSFLLNGSSVSALYVSNASDVGRSGIYSYQYMSANCNFISTARGINTINMESPSACSMWSYEGVSINFIGGGALTATASFYRDATSISSVTRNSVGITTNNEFGTDTSTDDASGINQFNVSTYFQRTLVDGTWIANQNTKAILFCDSNSSSIVKTETATACSISRQSVNLDYHNDYSIPFTSLSENLSIAFFGLSLLNGSGVNATTTMPFRLYNVHNSADCNITDNNVEIEYLTGLTNGSYSFSFNTSYWASGWNNLSIYCNDTSANFTDIKSLFVDAIPPDIKYINYSQEGINEILNDTFLQNTEANFTVRVNDTNNMYFSINITINATGQQKYFFENLSVSEDYIFNREVNLTTFPLGVYKVFITAKDGVDGNYINSVYETRYFTLFDYTIMLIDEATNSVFNLTNISVARLFYDDNRSYYDFKSTNESTYPFRPSTGTKVRFEFGKYGTSVIQRYVDLSLINLTTIRICVNKDDVVHYEQLMTSNIQRKAVLRSIYANCYVAADNTRFAYENLQSLRAFTTDRPYELLTDINGVESSIAGVDGGIASEINLDTLEFAQNDYSINIIQPTLSFAKSKTVADTIIIFYFNNKADSDTLKITITNLNDSSLVYSSSLFSNPNNVTIYFDYSALNYDNNTLFKIEAISNEGQDDEKTITRYFNTALKTGLFNPKIGIIVTTLFTLFGLTITITRYTLGWFGLLIEAGNIAFLSLSITAWYITFIMAIHFVIAMFITIIIFKNSRALVT